MKPRVFDEAQRFEEATRGDKEMIKISLCFINKKGMVVARFEPTEKMDNIAKQIEALL